MHMSAATPEPDEEAELASPGESAVEPDEWRSALSARIAQLRASEAEASWKRAERRPHAAMRSADGAAGRRHEPTVSAKRTCQLKPAPTHSGAVKSKSKYLRGVGRERCNNTSGERVCG